jgi:hypothetical protein
MRRLVAYSLAAPRANPRPDLVWQIQSSVSSLRAYNKTVPIVIFTYDDVPTELAPALSPYNVLLHYRGSYEEQLASLVPRSWSVLSRYPVLHKLLNFRQINAYSPTQVLCLDCDTLFFGDVELLFSRYAEADCYAREEPTCGRSHYGYDPTYLDEISLTSLGEQEGIRPVPPFNLGVILLNNGLWRHLAVLETTLLSYAWRFAVWIAGNPLQGVARYGEGHAIVSLRQQFDRLVDQDDRRRALPYPSANHWILDQVSLWLTLGHVPNLSYRDLSARDVLQDGEFLSRRPQECDWVLCHYFTQNMGRLGDWLRHHGAQQG